MRRRIYGVATIVAAFSIWAPGSVCIEEGPPTEKIEAGVGIEDAGLEEVLRKLRAGFGFTEEDRVAIVRISDQRLFLLRAGLLEKVYDVSTSKYGIGNVANSNKTPLGTHRVEEKYGEGAPLGTIFRARANTGQIARIHTDETDVEEDHITTRILRLKGLEKGVNQGKGIDSHERMIYIHGTPEEGLIGTPASHGCVRMRNADVVELFDLLPKGALVEIIK